MGFQIVSGSPQTTWLSVGTDGGSAVTTYIGAIVGTLEGGAIPLDAASGAYNLTSITDAAISNTMPYGVVIGTNLKDDVGAFNTTYNATAITSEITTHDNFTTEKALHDGIGIPKGDKAAMVKVAILDHTTYLKGPIYATSYGTALTEYAITGGTLTTGVEFTSATTLTGVEDFTTVCCRSGANIGISRVRYDTSTTAVTMYSPFPYDFVIGDLFVHANIRRGASRCVLDTPAMCILGDSSTGTNYLGIDVVGLDLTVSGEEYAIFRFNAINFLADL